MDGSDFFMGFRKLLNTVILPHMPDRPGEVKGVSATFSLDVRIAGRKQRLNISFDVVTVGWYDIFMEEDIETLYREFVPRIGPELTYNPEAWACIECGGPATDSAWMSLYNPKLHNRGTLLVYKACEKCAPKIQRYLLKLGIQNTEPGARWDERGAFWGVFNVPHGGDRRPRVPDEPLLQMPSSQVGSQILYSVRIVYPSTSVTCQKSGWARHKKICGKIQSVSWPEADETQCNTMQGSRWRRGKQGQKRWLTPLHADNSLNLCSSTALLPCTSVPLYYRPRGGCPPILTALRPPGLVDAKEVYFRCAEIIGLAADIRARIALVAALLINFATPRARSLADFDDALSRDAFTDMVLSRCGDASGTGVRPLQIWAASHEERGVAYLRGQSPGSSVFEREEGKTRGGEVKGILNAVRCCLCGYVGPAIFEKVRGALAHGIEKPVLHDTFVKISVVYASMTIRT
ncbi:hypothetical protein FB451DRAFT_1179087 [Mycena latifolia]|nr:hypothetical protein FB451DRAFT_1179087 [Mycena latifolia]